MVGTSSGVELGAGIDVCVGTDVEVIIGVGDAVDEGVGSVVAVGGAVDEGVGSVVTVGGAVDEGVGGIIGVEVAVGMGADVAVSIGTEVGPGVGVADFVGAEVLVGIVVGDVSTVGVAVGNTTTGVVVGARAHAANNKRGIHIATVLLESKDFIFPTWLLMRRYGASSSKLYHISGKLSNQAIVFSSRHCFDRQMKQWYNLWVDTTIRLMGQKIHQLRMDSWLTFPRFVPPSR
jgi:hypothetical protein